jgi:hypothetical protein
MGKQTGKPRGRPKGAKNRHTIEREEAIAEAAAETQKALGIRAFEGDAHALLMLVYKDTAQPLDLRLDAAKAAIGYEKPKLSAVDANVNGAMGHYEAQPIPTEHRHSDTVASPAGPAANGHSARPG